MTALARACPPVRRPSSGGPGRSATSKGAVAAGPVAPPGAASRRAPLIVRSLARSALGPASIHREGRQGEVRGEGRSSGRRGLSGPAGERGGGEGQGTGVAAAEQSVIGGILCPRPGEAA